MKKVTDMQTSVEILAAAGTTTKAIENVTPAPGDSSVATTSRRTVDIDRLLAKNQDSSDDNGDDTKSFSKGRATKRRKNSRRRKNKGYFISIYC